MKILFVTPFYKPAYIYGGPTRSIPSLAENLSKIGCDITVFTTNANGHENFFNRDNLLALNYEVNVIFYVRNIKNNFFYSHSIGNAIKEKVENFDLVYINSNWAYPFLPAGFYARQKNIPYVIAPRTSFMQSTWKGKYLKKIIYHYIFERSLINKSSGIHYTTELEQKESDWLKLKVPGFIVPNSVDLSEFKNLPPRGIFRKKKHLGFEKKIIIFLGRIESRKGLDFTLSAFLKSQINHSDLLLVIAGPEEDGYQKKLEQYAKQNGISEKVLFTGMLNPTQRLEALVDADLFVLTSYSENFGMSVVEAMAAGLPVIISDKVGIAPQIKETQSGVVVPLDEDRISNEINYMMNDNEFRRSLGDKAKKVAADLFSPESVAQKMLVEFERIIISHCYKKKISAIL